MKRGRDSLYESFLALVRDEYCDEAKEAVDALNDMQRLWDIDLIRYWLDACKEVVGVPVKREKYCLASHTMFESNQKPDKNLLFMICAHPMITELSKEEARKLFWDPFFSEFDIKADSPYVDGDVWLMAWETLSDFLHLPSPKYANKFFNIATNPEDSKKVLERYPEYVTKPTFFGANNAFSLQYWVRHNPKEIQRGLEYWLLNDPEDIDVLTVVYNSGNFPDERFIQVMLDRTGQFWVPFGGDKILNFLLDRNIISEEQLPLDVVFTWENKQRLFVRGWDFKLEDSLDLPHLWSPRFHLHFTEEIKGQVHLYLWILKQLQLPKVLSPSIIKMIFTC